MSVAVAARIDRERDRLVAEWRECCRIPSVSGDESETARMAAWLVDRLARVFPRVDSIPVAGHAPVVIAELPGTGDARLLVYTHYDVVPPGDESLWSSPPFDASVRGGAVYARGACDDKADITARLQAIELWLDDLGGPPPFTVVWLSEGAEEVGSPGLAAVLGDQRERLRADGCLWESFIRRHDGRPEIGFGCRGLLGVELSARLLPGDQHAAFSPVLRSAPAHLVRALASLTDESGALLIDGFYDDVLAPTEAELRAAAAVDPPRIAAERGRSPYVDADDGELARRLVFTPTVNIAALGAGDVGSGSSVVPAEARAQVTFQLVPHQEPDDILAKLRRHLDTRGFHELEIVPWGAVRPAKSPIDGPLAQAAIQAAQDVLGEPVLYPLLPGAGPARLFVEQLGTPTVSPAGTFRIDGSIHAPDEHGAISDYLDHVRFTARLLELFGEGS